MRHEPVVRGQCACRPRLHVHSSLFTTIEFLNIFAGLGLSDINSKEKEINGLTQTVFHSKELMQTAKDGREPTDSRGRLGACRPSRSKRSQAAEDGWEPADSRARLGAPNSNTRSRGDAVTRSRGRAVMRSRGHAVRPIWFAGPRSLASDSTAVTRSCGRAVTR